MSQIIRFAPLTALVFVLFVWSQPYSQGPLASNLPMDPNRLIPTPSGQTPRIGTGELPGIGIATTVATATPLAPVTPSPMPEWATGQRSRLETPVAIVILIAVLSIVLWRGTQRANTMNLVNFLEAVAGFLGWFVINTLLWVSVLSIESGTLILNPARLYPCCVNIPVLLVLGFTRRWAILGILAAILVNAVGMLLFAAPGPIQDDRFSDILIMLPFYISD